MQMSDNEPIETIDLSDIPEITDFTTARRNPYAEKLRKNGYTIVLCKPLQQKELTN
jgi:hypothetical protein